MRSTLLGRALLMLVGAVLVHAAACSGELTESDANADDGGRVHRSQALACAAQPEEDGFIDFRAIVEDPELKMDRVAYVTVVLCDEERYEGTWSLAANPSRCQLVDEGDDVQLDDGRLVVDCGSQNLDQDLGHRYGTAYISYALR